MTTIRTPGLARARSSLLIPAVPEGLVGAYIFGGSLERSIRNLVDGVDAQVFGRPTVEADGITLGGLPNKIVDGVPVQVTGIQSCLTTNIQETDDASWFVVGMATSAMGAGQKDPIFVSTNAGTAAADQDRQSNGAQLNFEADDSSLRTFNWRRTGTTNSNGGNALGDNEAGPPPNVMSLLNADFGNTGSTLRDITRGYLVSNTNTTPRDRTLNSLRFGANYSGNGQTGFVKMRVAFIYNRRITLTAERDAIAAQMRVHAAEVGIVV